MVEAIIDTRLRESISFHKVLHGFSVGKGTVAAILDPKLSQELASIYQNPLFLVFLDLRKFYDTVYRVRLLTTLEGYDAWSHMHGILEEFLERQEVVTQKNRYHGSHLQATR